MSLALTILAFVVAWLAVAAAMLWGVLRIARRHHPPPPKAIGKPLSDEHPPPLRRKVL